jgi:hypothetical protein
VIPGRNRKSIYKETTFEQDIEEPETLHDVIESLRVTDRRSW